VRRWKSGQYSFIDKSGGKPIADLFDDASDFHEGIAAVKIANQWGCIDKTGHLVVLPQFEKVGSFSEGLGWVQKREVTEIIDKSATVKGHILKLSPVGEFSEGLLQVDPEMGPPSAFGFVDSTGGTVIKPDTGIARKFSEGLARAATVRSGESKGEYTEDYKYGFINHTGKFVIAPTFDAAGDFSEGLAPVLTATETGEYNGLNPVCTFKWGYLDKTGKMLIKQQFQKASSFHEGCAAVQIADREDNSWVFIDKTGSKLFTQTWDQLGDFSNGLAPICLPVSHP